MAFLIIPSSINVDITKTCNNGESVSTVLDVAAGLQHHIFEFKVKIQ
jgi:hypothetical protein